MKNVLSMAGNYAAVALSNISSGNTLIPILGFLKNDGEHYMQRLMMGSTQAVQTGEQKLNEPGEDHQGVVFIKDGLLTLDSGKTDCLIIDISFSNDSTKRIELLIPYRHAEHEQGFAVHKLKLSKASGFDNKDYDWICDAFFDGLETNPDGGEVWQTKFIDEESVNTPYYNKNNPDFSLENFEKLKQAPFLIFFLVAAADGKVDKKEVKEFMEILANPDLVYNPLLNRIITNVIHEIPNLIAEMATQQINYISELENLKAITDNNLQPDEANAFKISLLQLGKSIAEASGGFFGFGNKISKEEKSALAAIAICLDIKAPQ